MITISNNNKNSIYRERLGEELKFTRLSKNYTIEDIVYMAEISKTSVQNIEKGTAKDIDLYVAYAQAVKYPLATLTDFNIPLKPINELPDDRLKSLNLTANIRKYIVNTNFLSKGKVVAEIKEELLRLNLIPEELKSVNIGGVMRNLKDDGIVNIGEKVGRKIVYFKPK